MTIKKRRDIEKIAMKKKIKDAAIELIEEEGYEKLSIRKIASKIEYSPTTIYLYYKDKAEIITDMSNDLYSKVEKNTVAILNRKDSLTLDKQVQIVLKSFVISLCEESEMAKAIMYSGTNAIFSNQNKNTKPSNSGITMLNDLFSKAIEENVIKSNIRNTSWMIISALIGFVMSAIENQLYQHEDFEPLVEEFIEIMMGGMRL